MLKFLLFVFFITADFFYLFFSRKKKMMMKNWKKSGSQWFHSKSLLSLFAFFFSSLFLIFLPTKPQQHPHSTKITPLLSFFSFFQIKKLILLSTSYVHRKKTLQNFIRRFAPPQKYPKNTSLTNQFEYEFSV